jgi:hypothetical protein
LGLNILGGLFSIVVVEARNIVDCSGEHERGTEEATSSLPRITLAPASGATSARIKLTS